MKHNKYKVYFANDVVITIRAFCQEDAIILAKAERISQGKEYHSIGKIENVTFLRDNICGGLYDRSW